MFTVIYDFIIHGREHVVNANVDAVSVYCVLALYVRTPYIIKLASMAYVYPENRDPTDFGMGPRWLNPALLLVYRLLPNIQDGGQ